MMFIKIIHNSFVCLLFLVERDCRSERVSNVAIYPRIYNWKFTSDNDCLMEFSNFSSIDFGHIYRWWQEIFSSWIPFDRGKKWFVIDFYDFWYSIFLFLIVFFWYIMTWTAAGWQDARWDARTALNFCRASSHQIECFHFNCEIIEVCWGRERVD